MENALIKVWRVISIGSETRTANYYREAIKRRGMKVAPWGSQILNRVACPKMTAFSAMCVNLFNRALCALLGRPWKRKPDRIVKLVNVSVSELGLDGIYCRDFFQHAKALGLSLCPPEVGPELRLQFPEQQSRRPLIVAMDPVADEEGEPRMFSLIREGSSLNDLWLSGHYNLDTYLTGSFRFIFVLSDGA